MAAQMLAARSPADCGALRQDWFAIHVPWHRISHVVDMTIDGGELVAEVCEDFPAVQVTILDLTGNSQQTRQAVAAVRSQVNVEVGDVLAPLPAGADYYLLPETLLDLESGRLGRLLQSVARACPRRGRAIACVPAYAQSGPIGDTALSAISGADERVARLLATAELAGLEVTRIHYGLAVLVEFGPALMAALPQD